MVVPDTATADRVCRELEEHYGDKPYHAVIIFGGDELTDDVEGMTIHHE